VKNFLELLETRIQNNMLFTDCIYKTITQIQ